MLSRLSWRSVRGVRLASKAAHFPCTCACPMTLLLQMRLTRKLVTECVFWT